MQHVQTWGSGCHRSLQLLRAARARADCRAGGNAPGAGKDSSATRSFPIIVVAMPDTTIAETVPTGIPLSGFQSWLGTAAAILNASPEPLTAAQIVAAAKMAGCCPRSQTLTPAQSVNRDLHGAVRRGDPRVTLGPLAGQFRGSTATSGAAPAPTPAVGAPASTAPRLPVAPLACLISARGGLWACGIRPYRGDPIERARWVARVERAYLRARVRGWISLRTADELAIKGLSLHPAQIWGDLWWDA